MNDPSTQDETRPTGSPAARTLGVVVLMVLILIAGAYLRLVGLDWDEGQHLHPDERFLSLVESGIRPVNSLAEYFDTHTSTLNPNNVGHGFFVYGDFPIIFVRYLAEWLGTPGYNEVHITGRVISAVADLLAIVMTYFTARHLFDRRVGVLAAALCAAAALPIQQSHFFTVDTFTNLFVVASFFFIARAFTGHRWVDYPLFGLMLGLGMASKVSIFPLATILIIALALRVWRETGEIDLQDVETIDDLSARKRHTTRLVLRATAGLVIAGLVTAITFRVAQPYAFLPPNSGQPLDEQLGTSMRILSIVGDPVGFRPNPAWLAQMEEVRRQVSGYSDIPPNHQWGKRLPLIFPWINMVRVGMGWPLGLFAWLAFFWALWEIGRGHRGAMRLMLPVIWTALYFTWQGIGWVKTMRYFLPVYPFLLMLAAWALVTLWDRIHALIAARRASRWHWSAWVPAGLATVVLVSAYAWGFAVSRIYTRPVTRVAASHWMLENIPSDVTLFLETAEGPRQFQLGLHNTWLDPTQFYGEDTGLTGDSGDSPLVIPTEDPARPVVLYSQVQPGMPQSHQFSLPFDGTLTRLRLNHVADKGDRQDLETLRVTLASDPEGANTLAEGHITGDFAATGDPRGASYTLAFEPVDLVAGQSYYLTLQTDAAGPLVLASSSVATEGTWDDPLPLSLAPYNVWGAQYQGYELQIHWEDIDIKRERMKYVLDRADYLTISSNRFYDAMPRNPQRYPLTIAYYRALFSGELGFELVGDFTSRPNLGPIEFRDDSAEEAWTVYDHPRVFIFKKTERYDPARTAAILDGVDLDGALRVIAKDARGRPVRIPKPDSRAWDNPNNGGGSNGSTSTDTGSARTDVYSRFQPLAVLVWWALMLVTGWVAFPALYTLFPGLPDRGYPLAKTFGLLFSAWLAWMAASLKALPWSGGTALLALLSVAVISAALVFHRRAEFLDWLRANRGHILFTEILMLVLFLVFLLIRLGNPDLWHPAYGGEKPMDLAYFNAVLKSRTFPPYDPWFAGETINYYYFGFVVVGLPVKLLNVPVTLAYNLILPTLFALTGVGAFSVAYNLVAPLPGRDDQPTADETRQPATLTLWEALRAWPQTSFGDVLAALRGGTRAAGWQPYLAGLAALLLTVVLGNLDEIRTIIWGLAELGSGVPSYTDTLLPDTGDVMRGLARFLRGDVLLPVGLGEWYWNATRLIPVPISETGQPLEIGPITEFPFFTFLYADLHAHMIALPITLLAIAWDVAQIRGARLAVNAAGDEGATARQPVGLALLNLLAGALIIGALRPTNTWDLPTYLVLGLGALVLAHTHRRRDNAALRALGLGIVLGGLLAAVTYFPDVLGLAALFAATPTRPGLLAALAVGALGLLFGCALWLVAAQVRAGSREDTGDAPPTDTPRPWITLLGIAVQAGVLGVGTLLLYRPYIRNYDLGYDSAIPWTGSRTPLWAYLDILGLFLFVIVTWLVWESWRWLQAAHEEGKRLKRAHVIPVILALALGIFTLAQIATRVYPVAALVLLLALWSIALFFRPGQPIEKRAALAMFVVALALTLLVEVIVLAGDIGRMNTVFKFHLQVWVLMALVAAAALSWLWPSISRAPGAIRVPWMGALAVLVLLAALYPLIATRAKVADRWSPDAPHTLDGMTYMPYVERYEGDAVFSLAPDYEALRWLQDNVEGTPVVLEAHTIEYHWGARVSIYTGLPSVIGWNWHQRQQRPEYSDQVWQRVNAVQQIYSVPDPDYALSLLEQYGVDLIIVGGLERAYYDASGLIKFNRMVERGDLALVYDRDDTQIYQVVKE